MNKYTQIMCKDVLVADNEKGWRIYHPELLPHNLDFLSEEAPQSFIKSMQESLFLDIDKDKKSEVIKAVALINYRKEQLTMWLSHRVLSIDRVNAKKILNALRLSQNQSPDEKASIALAYRAISLCDSWWIKFGEEDDTKWKDINLFENSLNESISLIGLSGGSMTLQAKHGLVSEVSVKGSYAKGWFREDKGNLYMYKSEDRYNEAKREVCASKVIDYFNVYSNLKYELVTKVNPLNNAKSLCSKCLLMSTPDLAVVHAAELVPYLNRKGTDLKSYINSNYKKEFSQMVAIDYLIANSDRHSENWGFFRSMIDGEIKGLHPLYDHNNAFDPDLLETEDTESILVEGLTMRQAARLYATSADLKLIKKPKASDFPNELSYNKFIERCKLLNLI